MKKIIVATLFAPVLAIAQSYPSPTYQNLTVLGTFTGTVSAASLAAQAANTVVANVTASSASPTAVALPSCSGSNSALKYTSASGFSCGTTYALTSANTFTGNQTISANTAGLTLNDTSGVNQTAIYFQNSGSPVWSIKNSSGATGSWVVNRYVGAVVVDSPISISNPTGAVTMADGITNSPISGSTGSFTTLAASGTVSGAGFTSLLSPYAPLASPTFTGTPVGPTASAGTNTTQLATTAFAQTAVTGGGNAGSFTTLAASGTITPSQTNGIVGTTTNNNANAGSVGEFLSSNVPSGSAVSLTSGVSANVTSISLTAGDWDVWGSVGVVTGASTVVITEQAGISTTSATLPTFPGGGAQYFLPLTLPTGQGMLLPVGTARVSVASTTTVYLVANFNFSTSTCSAYGFIGSRRRR